jgi:iron complex transport system substrate-binding protein
MYIAPTMHRRHHFFLLTFVLIAAESLAQVSVTDDLQRNLRLQGPASRVVSLAPSLTESLFAIGAGSQVAGITDYCNYPAEARRLPRVGGMINPNIEILTLLKPDLIVMSMEGNVRDDYRRMTSLGWNVFVSNPRTLDGIHQSLIALGTLTGQADSAKHLVEAMKSREASVKARSTGTPVRTLLIVSVQPLMVAGRSTFVNELITAAGGYNLAGYAPGNYPSYSRETVIANNPDVIIITSDLVPDVATLLAQFPEWKQVSAVRHNRVFRVNADVVSRPGPRAVDALELLSSLFHANP